MGLRMELFAKIRRDARVEGASIRELEAVSDRQRHGPASVGESGPAGAEGAGALLAPVGSVQDRY